MQTITQQLEEEIQRLILSDYRKQQGVQFEDRTWRHLKKLFGPAKSLRKSDVHNFCHYVSDIAGPTSRLAQLSSKLYVDVVQEDRG